LNTTALLAVHAHPTYFGVYHHKQFVKKHRPKVNKWSVYFSDSNGVFATLFSLWVDIWNKICGVCISFSTRAI